MRSGVASMKSADDCANAASPVGLAHASGDQHVLAVQCSARVQRGIVENAAIGRSIGLRWATCGPSTSFGRDHRQRLVRDDSIPLQEAERAALSPRTYMQARVDDSGIWRTVMSTGHRSAPALHRCLKDLQKTNSNKDLRVPAAMPDGTGFNVLTFPAKR
jgi:hypothetical protein